MKTSRLIVGFDGIEDLGIIGVLVGAMERNLGRAAGLRILVRRFEHVDRRADIVFGFFARCDDVNCEQMLNCIAQRCNRCEHIGCFGVGEHIAHIALAQIAQHALTFAVLVAA